MLEFANISFLYGKHKVLSNINLQLQTGEALILRGHNGSGKSTMLKLAAGLLEPHKGKIFFGNSFIQDHLAHYQKNLNYLGHKLGVHSLFSPYEHWHFELGAKYFADLKESFVKYLERCQLMTFINNPCCTLSAGQLKKVALFRLWAYPNRKLWILDEPFAMLDSKYIAFLNQHINEHIKTGGLVIYSAHENISCDYKYREYLL